MLVILDCGVRINELLNVAIEDYNSKDKTITIRSETAKTRETRINKRGYLVTSLL